MELYSECLRHATLSMKLARKDHYRRELADSYAMMAKTERVMGINDLGAQNFMNAMEIFNELGDRRNTRLARCWAAVTIGLVGFFHIELVSTILFTGQSIIVPYTNTVLKSDKEKFGNNRYMASLLDWKLSRYPFWSSTGPRDKNVSTTDTNFADSDDVNYKICFYL